MQNDEAGELEYLIDRALPSYGGPEPLAGLEQRVLARIRVAEAARRRAWIRGWVAASALAAVFALVAIATRPPDRPYPILRADLPAARLPQNLAANPPAMPHRHTVAVHRAAPPKFPPKLGQFPAPAFLTAEERALLAVPAAVADLRKRSEDPIQIEEIQIAPLSIDSGQ